MDEETREEQATELEALEAIFGTDYTLLEEATNESGARFQVGLTDDTDVDVKIRLVFKHSETYPRQPITLVMHSLGGVSAPRRRLLQGYLESVAQDNVDMPAAYTICEAARDWLVHNVVQAGGSAHAGEEEGREHRFETLDSTQSERVEVISSKAVGTPVTVETFAAWREKFMIEVEMQRSREEIDRRNSDKVTGREFFESRTVVVSAESESFWEAEAFQMESESAGTG